MMRGRFFKGLAFATGLSVIVLAGVAMQPEPPKQPSGTQPGAREPGERGGDRGGPGQRGPGGPRGQRTPAMGLEESMKTMGRSLKQLRGAIDDPAKKEANLRLIGEMERGCVGAKTAQIPPDVVEHSGGDAAKSGEKLRKDMLDLLKKLIAMEEAVDAGNNADAKKIVDDILGMREQGHKDFGVKDD